MPDNKENLIDEVLEQFDKKYDVGDIVQQFEDMYGNVKFYDIKDEVKDFIKQTLQKQCKKIAEDVIEKNYYVEDQNVIKEDLKTHFQSIGIDIN
jgi:hypothetical protein